MGFRRTPKRSRHTTPKTGEVLRRHARTRALQRFGLELGDADFETIIGMIHSNKATFLLRQSNTVTIWKVIFREKEMVAVYDKKRKELRTFMPWKETWLNDLGKKHGYEWIGEATNAGSTTPTNGVRRGLQ